jgi:hypothetical protein
MATNVWLNSEAREKFRRFFEKLSEEISKTISKSESRGDNVADEDYLTGKIIEIINNSDQEELRKEIRELLGLYVNIYARKNEGINENKIGADLGIILNVTGDNIEIKKAILVQAKKAKKNNNYISYPELKKRGKDQAQKMLRITPASFFFLYNPEDICKDDKYKLLLQDHSFRTSFKTIKKEDLDEVIHLYKHYRRELYYLWKELISLNDAFLFFPFSPHPFFPIRRVCGWYAGIMVLPATNITAIKDLKNVNLEDFLPDCVCFADFMVDYFLSCYVGDTRKRVLIKAGINPDLKDQIITRGTVEIKVRKE